MKQIVIIGLVFLSLISSGQIKKTGSNKLLTTKYSGIYSYGTNVEKGRIGTIYIYPETDNTLLFYIDLNRGAPSYNMGSLYGRVKITNDTGLFYTKLDYANEGCKWKFNFTKNSLIINTVDGESDCGFGRAVYADGEFKRKSNVCKEFFRDIEGKIIYFRNTSPEQYNKD